MCWKFYMHNKERGQMSSTLEWIWKSIGLPRILFSIFSYWMLQYIFLLHILSSKTSMMYVYFLLHCFECLVSGVCGCLSMVYINLDLVKPWRNISPWGFCELTCSLSVETVSTKMNVFYGIKKNHNSYVHLKYLLFETLTMILL